MEGILDTQLERNDVEYVGFGPRLGALLLDGLITGVPLMIITFANILIWKNLPLLVISNLLVVAYKPLLEGLHGATIGKKALKIKVVNTNLDKADWSNIILRNSLQITLSLVSLVPTIMMFASPDFEYVTGFMEYSYFASQHSNSLFSFIILVVYLADLIFMLSDTKKRSLHDRIGKTYVIKDTTV